MKNLGLLVRVLGLLVALTLAVNAQDILNNDTVIKMVKSGVGESLIVNMVQSQPGKYSLSPDDVMKLKEAGVSEKILAAMASKESAAESSSGSVKIELKTPVRLTVAETVSSKTAKAGETPFKLVAAEDVVVSGHVVIAKGSPAIGRVTAAEKKSFATHNGKLEVAVDSVRAVDGHNVAIEGNLSEGGGGVGFGRTGKDVEIEKGREVNAVVAAETEVKF